MLPIRKPATAVSLTLVSTGKGAWHQRDDAYKQRWHPHRCFANSYNSDHLLLKDKVIQSECGKRPNLYSRQGTVQSLAEKAI